MTSKLPGICFVGCGKIAQSHAKILKSLYSGIPLFFYDKDKTKSLEFKSKFNGISSFPDISHAFDNKDVNIIFITTPHAFHSEIACEAAKHGKDIIIEKPITRNLNELKKIISAADKYKVRCTVAENYLYKSFIYKIRDAIARGYIGKPLFIEVNKSNRDTISGWRTDPELMGGGALLEGGVHWVNLLVSLADSKAQSVIAVKPEIKYDTNIPFEDSMNLMVKFENGINGKLFHSWRIPNRFKGIGLSKIYGTDGVITFESNGLFTSVYGIRKKKYLADFTDFLGYKKMLKSFVDDYCNGKPWEPGLDRISMELKLVESAYRSIKSCKFEQI
ncbi:MAG TPA: Gfo/Idh/MocA family oxidoreductase [Spirochaetota bacterium]|nr:Gfo/Idh/MocA family oxidoreductase [Spirochaetota bacterium]HPS85426.1 Gfo/Idh/MocA family oxidoreductase [Spirochaetota bacterium]